MNNTSEESQPIAQLNTSLEAVKWQQQREDVLNRGKLIETVADNDQLDVVTRIAKEAKTLVKTLANKRLELTRPLDAAKKTLMDFEKDETKSLNALIEKLDGLAAAYAREQARKAEEERLRIEAAERARAEAELAERQKAEEEALKAAAANSAFGLEGAPVAPPPPPAPAPVLTPIPTVQKAHSSSASFTEVWKYEIIDANAVPRELCSPDDAKIRASLAARKAEGYKPDQVLITGLRIYADMQVRAR